MSSVNHISKCLHRLKFDGISTYITAVTSAADVANQNKATASYSDITNVIVPYSEGMDTLCGHSSS